MSPHAFPRPNVDQGVYTYIAGELLEGKVIYRDLWDHKGPVIYYVYALGLLVHKFYGVWLVGLLVLFIAVLISYRLFLEWFGPLEAFFGTLAWLFELQFMFDGGNTVEFFNLPLSFGALYLMSRWQTTGGREPAMLLGALGGISFFLRPNEIGILAATCAFCLFRAIRPPGGFHPSMAGLVNILVGFGSTAFITCSWLILQGDFAEFLDIVIRYNYLYAQVEKGILQSLFVGIYFVIPLFILSFTLWLMLLFRKLPDSPDRNAPFLSFLGLAFPIQIWLTILSKRLYPHYYISYLPVMSVMTVFSLRFLLQMMRVSSRKVNSRVGISLLTVLAALMLFVTASRQWKTASEIISSLVGSGRFPAVDQRKNPDRLYVNYIRERTDPADTVWFWGNQVTMNVQAGREAPSRFLYTYPFGVQGYPTESMIRETIAELMQARPALIIDASMDEMASIDSEAWRDDPTAWPLVEYIRIHFRTTDTLGPQGWVVWAPK